MTSIIFERLPLFAVYIAILGAIISVAEKTAESICIRCPSFQESSPIHEKADAMVPRQISNLIGRQQESIDIVVVKVQVEITIV